jgi:hypothetical protein
VQFEKEEPMANIQILIDILAVIAARIASRDGQGNK